MNLAIRKTMLGIGAAASVAVIAAPVEAQRYYRHRHNDDAAAAAIVGGIIGIGVGAAIASGSRDRYYDNGYYYGRPGYYGSGYGGYYGRGYGYDRGYYRGGGYGYYAPRCYTRRVYDPYYGRSVRVRYCD